MEVKTVLKKTNENNYNGFYEPSLAVEKEKHGKMMVSFSDSIYTKTEQGVEVKRQMRVGKQPIIVRSFFNADAMKTPTQQMLCVIDSTLEQKAA